MFRCPAGWVLWWPLVMNLLREAGAVELSLPRFPTSGSSRVGLVADPALVRAEPGSAAEEKAGFEAFHPKPSDLLHAACLESACVALGWRYRLCELKRLASVAFLLGLTSCAAGFSVSEVLDGQSRLWGALTVLAAAPLAQQTAKRHSFTGGRLSFLCEGMQQRRPEDSQGV